jgi:tetratricopeptide (TPR) repeat protein
LGLWLPAFGHEISRKLVEAPNQRIPRILGGNQNDGIARFLDEYIIILEPEFLGHPDGLEKARTEFEKIIGLTTGRLNFGDIYAKSFYMLRKFAEQRGDKTKAIEHYRKFLDLWKDADPGLPEVEDARKKLAWLK